ncbi:MAG: hypothetical protein OEZ10_14155 [Gammaproteobacteria bacterium]|nr:hypothetical protein [Gammaproteobacteria bacterium]
MNGYLIIRFATVSFLVFGLLQLPVAAYGSKYIQDGVILPWGSAEEGLEYVPDTGNYILTYKTYYADGSDMLYRIEFIPATKIKPGVKSVFKMNKNGDIRYSYKVKNGSSAEQKIFSVRMFASEANTETMNGPDGWLADIYRVHNSYGSDLSKKRYIGSNVYWLDLTKGSASISPGGSIADFAYTSHDLPGVGKIDLTGRVGKVMGFAGEGPQGEIGKKFNALYTNDFIVLPTAVAWISVPTPFNAAAVLEKVQQHIKTELVDLGQINADFVQELDRLITAAVAAINTGNLEAARHDIKALKQLLHREHKDAEEERHENDGDDEIALDKGRISKLASRVLIFDLEYVEARLK